MDSSENWVEIIKDSANDFWTKVGEYLPSVLGAIVLFVIGLIIARILSSLTTKGLKLFGLNKIDDNKTVKTTLENVGLKKGLSEVVSRTVFWVVILVFLMSVSSVLGLETISSTLNSIVAYIPNVLVAVIIIGLTIAAAKIVRDFVAAGLSQLQASFARTVAGISQWVVIAFGAVLSVAQLGVDTTILTANITLIVAGIVSAFALAFGLGSRGIAGSLVSGYYTRNDLKVGDKITIAGVTGRIKRLGSVNMVIETSSGDVLVANSKIAE